MISIGPMFGMVLSIPLVEAIEAVPDLPASGYAPPAASGAT